MTPTIKTTIANAYYHTNTDLVGGFNDALRLADANFLALVINNMLRSDGNTRRVDGLGLRAALSNRTFYGVPTDRDEICAILTEATVTALNAETARKIADLQGMML